MNPKFVNFKEEYRYTDKNTAYEYMNIYQNAKNYAEYNLQQFRFGLVVYDEIENFPKDSRNSRFMYPFTNQKTVTGEYLIEPKYKTKKTAILNMKRTSVCLERSPFSGLNIPSKLSYAAK